MIELSYLAGTIELRGLSPDAPGVPSACRWDPRSGCFRAPGVAYAEIVLALIQSGLEHEDRARRYSELAEGARIHRAPRPFQQEALDAWNAARGRGVVVLPTGAGKSQLGLMAIDAKRRSALIIAPTLDLVRQWYDQLREAFAMPIGVVGGGEHVIEPITVSTYDSAYLQMEHLGARFGLVIFDECHHLPSPSYALAAEMCLAPFRLGLTATLERADGKESQLEPLIGPVVYRKDITELAGEYLADYDTETIIVELSADEAKEYQAEREIYTSFLRRQGLRMSGPESFGEFLKRASRSSEGRRAHQAYRRQREVAWAAPAKIECVERLLERHAADRALLFTEDNAMAYRVARRFLIPAITHQTKVRERSEILAGLTAGRYGAVVTSKVLNEGVDVPAARVAIVISGSGSVREHVQRLGRVLRKQGDKRAVLYELVTGRTGETYASERRRDHLAYR